ncbi:flagellar motor protein [uncultured Sulfitobacter sp.]|jgi:hypothetical protein|uniref:flagellar motor protein n=1 Tax=Sulfitobacter sp. SH22 TaxID=3421172 RepID=UPI0025FC4504|nr:flagellar motor protein [uncultured Sulfitobacter sp.]
MSDTERVLVVLIDADDLKYIFAGWPDHICLATCLYQSGECSLNVFRRDERASMPKRLVERLKLQDNSVYFVPQVPGYETKTFFYSDERRLMTLIASDQGILEDALDYSVNYNYALEEGLDPALLLGLKGSERPTPQCATNRFAGYRTGRKTQTDSANSLLPEFLRRSAERSRRPQFSSRRSGKSVSFAQA